MKAQGAEESPEVVMGTLLVNSFHAKVLFDSGASHSFISQSFANTSKINFEQLSIPLLVKSPGSSWQSNKVSQNVEITMGNLPFQASLIALRSSDIDVILGMDWLVANKAVIDCPAKSVKITHPSGQIVYFHAENPVVQLYTLNANPLPSIETVPVVCDFPDVFPEELPGMPPDRAVEFVIELEPGTAPISKYPYKIAPPELKLLKEQIDMYMEKGYIQPSSSAWGCPTLFVAKKDQVN